MSAAKKTIFVVDDTRSNLQICNEALNDLYSVFTFTAPAQFFKTLERKAPDLIILDVEMPELDGFQVLTLLKNDPRFSQVPVVFMTAYVDEDRKSRGIDLGAVDFIGKPIEVATLQACIATHI